MRLLTVQEYLNAVIATNAAGLFDREAIAKCGGVLIMVLRSGFCLIPAEPPTAMAVRVLFSLNVGERPAYELLERRSLRPL